MNGHPFSRTLLFICSWNDIITVLAEDTKLYTQKTVSAVVLAAGTRFLLRARAGLLARWWYASGTKVAKKDRSHDRVRMDRNKRSAQRKVILQSYDDGVR